MTTQPLMALLPPGSVYLDRDKSLTPQIVDDLKTRMLSGQYPQSGPLPTVSGLAEFYDVTDQIMSNALIKLVKENWVIKSGYGSYAVAPVIPPVKSVETSPITLTTAKQSTSFATQETIVYCSVCGIWTSLPETILAALPAELTLACTADKTALIVVRLDTAKRIGTEKEVQA